MNHPGFILLMIKLQNKIFGQTLIYELQSILKKLELDKYLSDISRLIVF